MKITILGGKGFIGGHLVDHYIDLGFDVNIIDNESTGQYVNSKGTYFVEDLSTIGTGLLSKIVEDSEVVLHLASTARVQPSYVDPVKYFQNNILSLVNVLETLRLTDYTGRFIYFSTSSVYGPCNKYHGNVETSVLDPTSPYALSKKHCEEICEWYRTFYHLDIVIVRPFNIYGERMSNLNGYQTVIQKFFDQYTNNESLTVWGEGNNARDYTYIGDLVNAIDLIINNGTDYVYNIASNQPKTINAIIDVFPWQYPVEYLPKVNEPIITRGNITRLKKIGYSPKGNVLEWIAHQIPNLRK